MTIQWMESLCASRVYTIPSLPCPQVKALKEKIETERGKDNFPVSGQKLIYAGKILQDDMPIKHYKIDEKNFVVVMVSKVNNDRTKRG